MQWPAQLTADFPFEALESWDAVVQPASLVLSQFKKLASTKTLVRRELGLSLSCLVRAVKQGFFNY